MMSNNDKYHVSVVIPTIGGYSLVKTIEKLNSGTLVPQEILVCIPEDRVERIAWVDHENVKVVSTPCYGQVAQRAIGFQQVREQWVLQLDDDIFLDHQCLEDLVKCAVQRKNSAVGPKLFDKETGEYHSHMSIGENGASSYEKILFWVINGRRGFEAGKISKAGINMGVPQEPADWEGVEWLSGGCVLHRKENLILHDYYPFKGKAFAEDLFHSYLLREKGVDLCRCGSATCRVDFSSGISSLGGYLSLFIKSRKALLGFAKMAGGNFVRLNVFLFINLVWIAVRKYRSH